MAAAGDDAESRLHQLKSRMHERSAELASLSSESRRLKEALEEERRRLSALSRQGEELAKDAAGLDQKSDDLRREMEQVAADLNKSRGPLPGAQGRAGKSVLPMWRPLSASSGRPRKSGSAPFPPRADQGDGVGTCRLFPGRQGSPQGQRPERAGARGGPRRRRAADPCLRRT